MHSTMVTERPPAPARSGRAMRVAAGIVVALLGLVAGIAFGVGTYLGARDDVERFARAPMPAVLDVAVAEPSRQVVYVEGDLSVRFADLAIEATGPGGEVLDVEPYGGEVVYETSAFGVGRAVAAFDADVAGTYQVRADGVDQRVAVGASFARMVVPGVVGGIAIAGLSVILGLVVGLTALIGGSRRR